MKLREEKARRPNTGEEPRLEGGQSSARRTAAGVPGCQGDGTGAGRRSRKRPACRTIHELHTAVNSVARGVADTKATRDKLIAEKKAKVEAQDEERRELRWLQSELAENATGATGNLSLAGL